MQGKLFLMLFFISSLAFAQTEAPEYQLIELLGGKDQIVQIHNDFVSLMSRANPELAPYEATLREWAETWLTWDEIREGMAGIYRKYFTAEELADMARFYATPTGRKSIVLLPTLFREGNQLSADLAQIHQQELINMLRARAAQEALEQPLVEQADTDTTD